MAEAEIEIVRDLYTATNERDWDRANSHWAPGAELVIQESSGLRSGTFRGKDEVVRWFGDWFSSFDRDIHFEFTEIRELADGSIYTAATHTARGRTSGVELEMTVFWFYELDDGRVTRAVHFLDRTEAEAELAERDARPD
jgi:ketosteroid isomerase-like protein